MGSFSRFMVIIPFSEKQKEDSSSNDKEKKSDSEKEKDTSTASFEATSRPLTTSASQPAFSNYTTAPHVANFTLDEGNRSKSFADKDEVAESKEDGGVVFHDDYRSSVQASIPELDAKADLASTLEKNKLGYPENKESQDLSGSNVDVSHESFEVASLESLVPTLSEQSASPSANGNAVPAKKKDGEAVENNDVQPDEGSEKPKFSVTENKPEQVEETDKSALNGIVDRQLSKRDLHASVGEDSTAIDDYVGRLTFEEILLVILEKHKIMNSMWTLSRDATAVQATFVVESGRLEEDLLDDLLTCGIGTAEHTSVSISPLTVCMGSEIQKKPAPPKENPSKKLLEAQEKESKAKGNEAQKSSFKKSPSFADSIRSSMNSLKRQTSGKAAADTVVNDNQPVYISDAEPDEGTELIKSQEQKTVQSDAVKGIIDKVQKDKKSVTIIGGDKKKEEKSSDEEESSAFMKSIKSRIIVQPIVNGLKKNAEFTFDYLMFCVLASLIAACGLIEDNSVIIVASMLISPLMGPILAGVFGLAVKDSNLTITGIKSELYGLGLCVLTGFIVGLPVNFIMADQLNWTLASDEWPTKEMYSRGTPRNLASGAVIALASGAAVALSVLGENVGSLVGVAISASLLPPAVNSGLLIAFSLKSGIKPPVLKNPVAAKFDNYTQNSTELDLSNVPPLVCPELLGNTYQPVFSCNLSVDGIALGLISFLLTIMNIALIIVAGFLFLKLKQVSPRASITNQKEFWTRHIKVAKHYNTTVKAGTSLGRFLINETKQKLKISDVEAVSRILETVEEAEFEDDDEVFHRSMSSPIYRTLSTQMAKELTVEAKESLGLGRQLSTHARLERGHFKQYAQLGRFQVLTENSMPEQETETTGL